MTLLVGPLPARSASRRASRPGARDRRGLCARGEGLRCCADGRDARREHERQAAPLPRPRAGGGLAGPGASWPWPSGSCEGPRDDPGPRDPLRGGDAGERLPHGGAEGARSPPSASTASSRCSSARSAIAMGVAEHRPDLFVTAALTIVAEGRAHPLVPDARDRPHRHPPGDRAVPERAGLAAALPRPDGGRLPRQHGIRRRARRASPTTSSASPCRCC